MAASHGRSLPRLRSCFHLSARVFAATVLAVAWVAAPAALAGQAGPPGEALFIAKGCQGCHGAAGAGGRVLRLALVAAALRGQPGVRARAAAERESPRNEA